MTSLPDVIDVPVADRPGPTLAVAVWIQTYLLVPDIELDVVGLVHGRRDTQERAVQRLRLG